MPIPEFLTLNIPRSEYPRIVIIGGGFAGLNLAKSLKKAKAQVVMLDRNNFHTFQPLLYQVATAGLEPDSIAGPLRKTFKGHFNYLFRMVKVTAVDFDNNEIITKVGRLSYDYLVIANGSGTNYFGNSSLRSRVLPLKRIVHALDLRSHLLQIFEQVELTDEPKEIERLMNIVVVGGGPTGVEVSGAIAELKNHILPKDYPDLDFSKMKISLLEGADRLLNGMSDQSGKAAVKALQKMGVTVKLNTMVKNYENGILDLGNEKEESETVIWAAGVQGRILDGISVEKVEKSRIMVDQFSRVKGMKNVFAIGDVAAMVTEKRPQGHPMLAPVAIQQGGHLGRNFIKLLNGKEMKPFKYLDKGSLATIGRNKAVVDLPGGIHFKGFLAWIIWMFVHIMYLVGFRNKLVTLNNWIWSYFTYDKGTRLIIRTFSISNRKKLLGSEDYPY